MSCWRVAGRSCLEALSPAATVVAPRGAVAARGPRDLDLPQSAGTGPTETGAATRCRRPLLAGAYIPGWNRRDSAPGRVGRELVPADPPRPPTFSP